MTLSNYVSSVQNIMRKDSGVNGDAQRIEQMTWILFLKIFDAREETLEFYGDYKSIIPENLRWKSWAVDNKDGNALTSDALLDFVNNELFPGLKNMENNNFIKEIFTDNHNYMTDGIHLRQVINKTNELNFEDYDDIHAFGEIYESILKDLQSAGNAGEFYTPRAVTDFMAEILNPKLGDKIADFACGTGGFLVSVLNILDKQRNSSEDIELYENSVYGIEKKALPYMLCVTNMLLHNINNPNIIHGNSFDQDIRDYGEEDKFDIIIMNPPYGGKEDSLVQNSFPTDLRSSETADLFLSVIMYRLKKNGKSAVILPDGFLFGTDNTKKTIKKKLLEQFNLHTIIRMPSSVFAPYTSIKTNILFFDNTHPTEETWIYRMDMPEGYKHFSKTKPIKLEHFDEVKKWWNNRENIKIEENDKARKYTIGEIIENNYNLDLCNEPHKEDEILPPDELISEYLKEKTELNNEIDNIIYEIKNILNG